MKIVEPDKLRSIKTLPALLAYLRDELDWPVESLELDELTFDWSADQLRVSDSQARRLTAGVIRQLRPLAAGQPWGIFVVEFADDTFRRGALREILRGLVANRRRDPTLPAWQHDNLLFICTTCDYERITFAHYRGEKAQKARLALFGWQCGSSYLRTLCEFNLPALRWPEDAADTSAWLKQWASAFDKEPLTKEFFKEIANWYFWTLKNCRFPKDAPKEADGYDHISVIRLITRLIFCWFIREKGLISDALFDEHKLAEALLEFDPGKVKNKDSVFYRAILQNLFFATLNTEMDKRGWAKEDQNFMAHNLYRHKECFRKPGEALALFKNIPFLNGGLFECLDKDFGENAKPRYLRIDGFSRRPDSQPVVPDFLFFGPEQEVDLSKDYGDKKFRKVRVRGLIQTLNHYKFTIEENTPFDQEVALDPELCGKVFENLLAAYNPETGTTARKATGSFYTPREIVDYMVDKSLVAFLNGILITENKDGTEKKLRQLLAYTDELHGFNEAETEKLIDAIDHLKALDPAVGSGAFPMGILHKLVHVLKKLDPDNERWKAKQIAKLDDVVMREEAERVFRDNYDDYGRKLFLIENCIYGVDIQPIAVQIAKMRFFISLIVDQKVNPEAPNLGVRALPNLETKFVAANTLIGIHRPEQMLLRNPAIDKKEAELRQVREKHFNAKTPANKAKWREQDKKLRTEIAEMLKTDGWDDKTAKQLAAWDPYGQNTSAGFFDPEWMFGITSGFDVVIGNPPYVRVDDIQPEQRETYRDTFRVTEGKYDLYFLFFEKGFSLRNCSGVLAYISPNKFCAAISARSLRRLMFESSKRVDIASTSKLGVFEDAANYPVISLCFAVEDRRLLSVRQAESLDAIDQSTFKSYKIPVSRLDDLPDLTIPINVSQEEVNLVLRLRKMHPRMGASAAFSEGLRIPASYESDKRLECLVVKQYQFERWIPIRDGSWVSKKNLDKVISETSERYRRIMQDKVVLAEDGLAITATLDDRQTIPQGGVYFGVPLTKDIRLEYLLGVLNSCLASTLYRILFSGMHMGGGYMRYRTVFLEELPFPVAEPKTQSEVAQRVRSILAAKKADPSADTLALEREIDERVYRLYGLTPEEIKIVESEK